MAKLAHSLFFLAFALSACAHEPPARAPDPVAPAPAPVRRVSAGSVPDQKIERNVRTLLALADLSPFDVQVESRRGIVSLSGTVPGSSEVSERLVAAVGSLQGVRKVNSELTTRAAAPAATAASDPWWGMFLVRLAIMSAIAMIFFALGSRITRNRIERRITAFRAAMKRGQLAREDRELDKAS